ncbi:MAG: hypothetical protein QXK37_00990 [Candidatus Woesearchaeota archaeon]
MAKHRLKHKKESSTKSNAKKYFPMKINKKDKSIVITLNPKIYPLSVIYAASYVIIDRAYVILDGNPLSSINVYLKPKSEDLLMQVGNDFLDELLNYAVHEAIAEQNRNVQFLIARRALTSSFEEPVEYMEDPFGIAVPWEKKYGKK